MGRATFLETFLQTHLVTPIMSLWINALGDGFFRNKKFILI
jgi:hypothetical protein